MRIIICVGTHSLMCSSSGLEAPCIIQVKRCLFLIFADNRYLEIYLVRSWLRHKIFYLRSFMW